MLRMKPRKKKKEITQKDLKQKIILNDEIKNK
jgi:hypothetical protein